LLRTADGAIVTIRHTLLPSPYPRIQFEEAVDIQRSFNSLFLRVASDYEFMESTFKPLSAANASPPTTSCLLLSAPRSVEKLRGCPSATRFGSAIARAVEEYVKSSAHLQRTCLPAVLMVVSENETNIYDQRSIEEAMLCANVALRLLRRTFAELGESARRVVVEESTGRLFVDGHEVALVYYRTGYAPHHFDEEAWQTKLRLERSLAIKCPSIDYLLANMKLVQTALAAGSTSLSRFGVSVGTAERLAAAFARQTVLSTDFNFADPVVIEKMVDECRRGPDKFVLKPQREGGGNNVFGGETTGTCLVTL
uniref:Glutathione synthetase n=1 Tax=Hydatigena taeniaeformis TaxID=6205 RepID=A0A0R3WZK0_HYDTA